MKKGTPLSKGRTYCRKKVQFHYICSPIVKTIEQHNTGVIKVSSPVSLFLENCTLYVYLFGGKTLTSRTNANVQCLRCVIIIRVYG